ncbi:MAG TPA: fused MFS/spermidine synthase [Solirubrobacterales bacterium]|nr:fused MFS/spermidine synthase [Solirubrobacterales bacterium]
MAKGKKRRQVVEPEAVELEEEVELDEEGAELEEEEVELEEEDLPRALPAPLAAALVFVAAGAVLMLEILAVRLLAPYVGLTLETTTSIIGAALAGIALGAAVGGRIADRTDTRLLLVGLFAGGGALALLIVPIVHWLGPGARGDGDLAALGITVITLVPAATVLSAVSPAVAHLQLHDLRASGTVVGSLSGWATAGALLGTFGTGFVLVPWLPVTASVLIIGGVLVLIGAVLAVSTRLVPLAGVAGGALLLIVLGAWSGSIDSPCDTETKYHCISLEADPARPNSYALLLDDLHHSYVDLDDPTYLDFAYTKWIAKAIQASNPGKQPVDAVFVGGGGFTLPRWLLATRPGSNARVLEVDEELVTFDEEHLGLRPQPGLEIEVGDARIGMLEIPDASADVVVGDAFGNMAVPWHLATTEWVEEVQRVLKPGGLYALNVIDLGPLDLLRAETATVLDTFDHVQMVTFGVEEKPLGGNGILLASDRPIPERALTEDEISTSLSQAKLESFSADAEILRDDFAPADQLLTTP